MAVSPLTLFLLFVISAVTGATPASAPVSASLHRTKLLTKEWPEQSIAPSGSPTTFFEVTRPIPTPKTPPCSVHLLQHDFAFTYGRPPVTAAYNPPSHCPSHSSAPSRIVLEWSAACSGRQFDRIFGVWLSGAELLRSCTAEPRQPPGIVWSVRKDITRYSSLLSLPGTLAVYLGNLVDATYTGVYHVNISIHFYYPASPETLTLTPGFSSPADLIIPISRTTIPSNDGLWFQIQNSTDIQSADIAIPRNAYRAVLELYVSFHSNDEFWYTNPPNVYISSNNLTGIPGNGPFRDIVVSIDGKVVGAVWPFTVIFTGGINPLLWRPITAIGSYNLPSYDIEITPFLGQLLDGKLHKFGFGVANALDYWYVDANLHLWLDGKSKQTVGKLISYEAPAYVPTLVSKFSGLDGSFDTAAKRQVSATGWVKSSYGKITTHFFQRLEYKNWMQYSSNGSTQIVNQTIDFNYGTYAKHPSSVLYSEQVFQNFPLYIYTGTADQVNDTYSFVSNVSLGFNIKKFAGERFGFSFSSLKNSQNADGYMRVKGNLVTSGLGNTQQVYRYEGPDGCYFRKVSSSNYTILHDDSGKSCTNSSRRGSEMFSTGWLPSPARRTATDLHNSTDGY